MHLCIYIFTYIILDQNDGYTESDQLLHGVGGKPEAA